MFLKPWLPTAFTYQGFLLLMGPAPGIFLTHPVLICFRLSCEVDLESHGQASLTPDSSVIFSGWKLDVRQMFCVAD